MSETPDMTPAKVLPSTALREQLADQRALATVFMESGLMKSAQSQAQAIVFMLAGSEMGLQPYESMNAFDIIEGKVAMRANTRAAQVKRSGRYNYRVAEHTQEFCRIEWFEKEDGKWVPIGESSFSIAEAQRAGLTGKKNWQGYAMDMLFARALSRGQRQHCPEVTGGSRYYDPDEVGDDDESPVNGAAPKEGSLNDIKAKVAAKVAPAATPEVIEAVFSEEPTEEQTTGPTKAEKKAAKSKASLDAQAPPKPSPSPEPPQAETPVETTPAPETVEGEVLDVNTETGEIREPKTAPEAEPEAVTPSPAEGNASVAVHEPANYTELGRSLGMNDMQILKLGRLQAPSMEDLRDLCDVMEAKFGSVATAIEALAAARAFPWATSVKFLMDYDPLADEEEVG